MSKVCEVCGKHPVAGRSISHSHRVTNRKFRPNIQRVYVVVDGHRRKMNVCSTCLKSPSPTEGAFLHSLGTNLHECFHAFGTDMTRAGSVSTHWGQT